MESSTGHLSSSNTYCDMPLKISQKDLSYSNILRTLQNQSQSSQRDRQISESSRGIPSRHMKTTETEYVQEQLSSQNSHEYNENPGFFQIPIEIPSNCFRNSIQEDQEFQQESDKGTYHYRENQIYNYLVTEPSMSLREKIENRLQRNRTLAKIKRNQMVGKAKTKNGVFKNAAKSIESEIEKIISQRSVHNGFNAKQATFRPNGRKIFEDIDEECETLRRSSQKKPRKAGTNDMSQTTRTSFPNKENLPLQSQSSCFLRKSFSKEKVAKNSLTKMSFQERQNRLIQGREDKYKKIRDQQSKKEVQECTFKPKLTPYKR